MLNLAQKQAIDAYNRIAADPEFVELVHQREIALHNEASALRHARDQGRTQGQMQEREKWQGVLAGKNAENELLRRQIAEFQARLGS